MDLGAGILWQAPERGISGALRGHTLLAYGEEEFQEQGLALSFSWAPNPSNRGPSLSLNHAMGATTAGGRDRESRSLMADNSGLFRGSLACYRVFLCSLLPCCGLAQEKYPHPYFCFLLGLLACLYLDPGML